MNDYVSMWNRNHLMGQGLISRWPLVKAFADSALQLVEKKMTRHYPEEEFSGLIADQQNCMIALMMNRNIPFDSTMLVRGLMYVDDEELDEERKKQFGGMKTLFTQPECILLSQYVEKMAYSRDSSMGDVYTKLISTVVSALKEGEECEELRENIIGGVVSIQSIVEKQES